jgi:glycosyl transferase family 25
VGASAYILSREAAGHLIDATQTINLSIDHFLFNPNNSPVFKRLRPSQILPAIAEQGGDVAASDIHGTRLTQRTYTLDYWQREAIRGLYEIRHIPKFILLAMRGRVKLEKVIFDPSGTHAA